MVPKVKRFREWLLAEMREAQDQARCSRSERAAGFLAFREIDRLEKHASSFAGERPADLGWKIAVTVDAQEDMLADRHATRRCANGIRRTIRR